MRIVLDTNVLISALMTKGTPPYQLQQALLSGKFELVTSRAQLEEFSRVLGYKRLKPYIRAGEVAELIEMIDTRAVILEALPEVDFSPDPDDNPILATAIAGEADLIVSGDKPGMLRLIKIKGIPIVTPKQALRRIKMQDKKS